MLDTFKQKGRRERLVELLRSKGIREEKVLEAIGKVPRHRFVSSAFMDDAYEDKALPISQGQTISQPFTVAFQTQSLALEKGMKILEIGTGSGYQAAILCAMGMKVYSIEIEPSLHRFASEQLDELDLSAELRCGDGSKGWDKHAPYDRIIVTAASPSVPDALRKQLAIKGKMVIPVGNREQQEMWVVTRLDAQEYLVEKHDHFRFVPLRGQFGFPDRE